MKQENIGAFIANLRKEKGWTQKEMASQLGVSDKAISKWETGKSLPDMGTLIPVSELLGITVDELLSGKKRSADNTEGPGNEPNKVIIDYATKIIERTKKTYRLIPVGILVVLVLTLAIGISILTKYIPMVQIDPESMAYLLLIHNLTTIHILLYSVVLFASIMGNLGMIFGIFHRNLVERFALGPLVSFIRLFKRKYDSTGIQNALDKLYLGLNMLKKKGWRKPAVGSLMNVGFDMLCLYLIFIAAGHPIHIIVLIAGYGFSILVGLAAFFVPGGVGVVESGLVAIFTSLGVPAEISVIASLSYRLFSFWTPSVLGFAVSGYLGRQN